MPALHESGVSVADDVPEDREYVPINPAHIRYTRIDCKYCGAPSGFYCATNGGNVLYTDAHATRRWEAYKLEDAERAAAKAAEPAPTPATAYADARHKRNAERRMHLNDQAVGGLYRLDHDEYRGHFNIVGFKCRTGGRVTLATFKYRAADEMYLPMFEQARALAEGIVSQMNAINLVLKDPRHA